MGEIRKYKKGEIISKEGDFELWMYDFIVWKGWYICRLQNRASS